MRRRFLASLAFLIATLTGCGGDGGTGPNASLPGTYTLSTIAALPLPFLVYEEQGYKVELIGGSFVVGGSGTFTETLIARETDSRGTLVTPVQCPGTYTRSGNTLSLIEPETDECGGSFTATWNGRNQLDVDYFGVVAVYKR